MLAVPFENDVYEAMRIRVLNANREKSFSVENILHAVLIDWFD